MKYAQILKNIPSNKNTDTEKDLLQINKFTRRKLSADDVFIFSVVLCDNEIDRDFEQFTTNSLDSLKTLFLGKTGIFDHVPTLANQTARIFFTDVITDDEKCNAIGQPYKYLFAKAYMVKSEKNKDLILEIDAGIKKEISVGCSVKNKLCSICGADHKVKPCNHKPGKRYFINNQEKICYLELTEPLDAYEWSFVAVPAQINAGVIKNFNNSSFQTSNIIDSFDPLQITKHLANAFEPCFITKDAAKTLSNYILNLQEKSAISSEFLTELKDDVYKMFTISKPSFNKTSIEKMVQNLPYAELKELKLTLSKELNSINSSPQLLPLTPKKIEPESDEENKVFTI